jgi:Bardet-Biedl syndrome 9 protein
VPFDAAVRGQQKPLGRNGQAHDRHGVGVALFLLLLLLFFFFFLKISFFNFFFFLLLTNIIYTHHSLPQAIPLTELFPDLLPSSGAAGGAIGLCHHATGQVVTVVEGKSGGRYRVQGAGPHIVSMVAAEIARRVPVLAGPKAAVQFADPPPTVDPLIDAHHAARLRLRDAMDGLERGSRLVLNVQKRLLVRFMDKNAPPLAGMDVLMERALRDVSALAAEAAEARARIESTAADLAAALRLVTLTLTLTAARDPAAAARDAEVLEAAMAVTVLECEDADGWEETAEAGLSHLLRTVLAKSHADAATVASQVKFPEDPDRIKKILRKVVDRAGKGATLAQAVVASAK